MTLGGNLVDQSHPENKKRLFTTFTESWLLEKSAAKQSSRTSMTIPTGGYRKDVEQTTDQRLHSSRRYNTNERSSYRIPSSGDSQRFAPKLKISGLSREN
jgi:hypothetical protein